MKVQYCEIPKNISVEDVEEYIKDVDHNGTYKNRLHEIDTILTLLPESDQKLYSLYFRDGKKQVTIARMKGVKQDSQKKVTDDLSSITDKIYLISQLPYYRIDNLKVTLDRMMGSKRDKMIVSTYLDNLYSIRKTARKLDIYYKYVQNLITSIPQRLEEYGDPDIHKLFCGLYKNARLLQVKDD